MWLISILVLKFDFANKSCCCLNHIFFIISNTVMWNHVSITYFIWDHRSWKLFQFVNDTCNSPDDVEILLYHDVDEIFWPQPIRLLKLGQVTGRGCMSPTWVGRVSDLGKNGFHNKCKNLDNIAVYLTAHLEWKWKNKQIINMNSWIWQLFFLSMF